MQCTHALLAGVQALWLIFMLTAYMHARRRLQLVMQQGPTLVLQALSLEVGMRWFQALCSRSMTGSRLYHLQRSIADVWLIAEKSHRQLSGKLTSRGTEHGHRSPC